MANDNMESIKGSVATETPAQREKDVLIKFRNLCKMAMDHGDMILSDAFSVMAQNWNAKRVPLGALKAFVATAERAFVVAGELRAHLDENHGEVVFDETFLALMKDSIKEIRSLQGLARSYNEKEEVIYDTL